MKIKKVRAFDELSRVPANLYILCPHAAQASMASAENLLPRPPSRGRVASNAPLPESVFLSPTKQQLFQRPSSPRIILQPIAAERGPGAPSSSADRVYLSHVKHDIHSLCKSAEVLQRDLDMQRRPSSSLSAKSALARRPITPSAAGETIAHPPPFRSDGIEASLGKILAQADAADGACKLCVRRV